MLNLSNATRLYTDTEILEKFANYLHVNGFEHDRLQDGSGVDAVALMSELVGYDPDFIKGFVGRTIQDMRKDKSGGK